jgi:cullin-4
MSHPHATAPKRPFSSSSSSPASPAPPHMKKAKLPASSSSAVPTEKNGLHLDPTAAAAARSGGRTNGEEDAEMLLADQDEVRPPSASTPGGVTANLFRKKATLPQPSAAAATRKPLRIKIGQPKLPKNFEEDTWAILKDAITAIFLKQKLSCDVEKLYQVISCCI